MNNWPVLVLKFLTALGTVTKGKVFTRLITSKSSYRFSLSRTYTNTGQETL